MGSRPEYTWCVESANGDFKCQNPANPTNDLFIPTKMPRLRTPVTQFFLGSIELPLAQLLIEPLWNTIYFDEGVRIIVNSDSELCTREFTVIADGTRITGIIPILYNPIVDVDLTDPTAPIFTTQFDHALDIRGQWNWGQPIQLVSTPLTDPALINLTTNNTNLTILNAAQFQLTNVPAVAYPAPGGIYGYVHAPPIASPAYLAQIVQAAMNLVAPGQFSISYSIDTGRFTFRSIATMGGTCVTNPPLASRSLQLFIPFANCLASIMGFGGGTVPVPTVPSPSDCKTAIPCDGYALEGGHGYKCFSYIRLTPQNYGPDSFASQLYLQWNRFFFDGGCANDAGGRPAFVFSTSDGTCVTFPIEYGSYTPDTFAEYLQTHMNNTDPLGNTYTVTWNMQTGQMCFQINTPGATFGLEFASATNTFNPGIIGFETLAYRGETSYCSINPFFVPTNTCCGTDMMRFSSLVFTPRIYPSQGKLTVSVSPPRSVPVAQLTDIGDGLVRVCAVAPTLVAHGLQPEDLAAIRDTATGITYSLRVIEVVDAFCFNAEIGSVTTFAGVTDLLVSVSQGDAPVASLLWADRQRPNRLYPRFLGYGYQDALYQPGVTPPFVGPYAYDIEPPKHVLLSITEPNGATHTNHAWRDSNLAQVFAKIILYPQFRLERSYPMIMYTSQVDQVTGMRFVFVNPEEHTPYQFHGKNWSLTICMVVAEPQLEMTCY